MANQEQLRTLKKEGVEVWNLWREDNPDVKIDLSDADLSGANLSGTDLSEAKLIGVNLREANLSRVRALRTNFDGATLTGACIQEWNRRKLNNKWLLEKVNQPLFLSS